MFVCLSDLIIKKINIPFMKNFLPLISNRHKEQFSFGYSYNFSAMGSTWLTHAKGCSGISLPNIFSHMQTYRVYVQFFLKSFCNTINQSIKTQWFSLGWKFVKIFLHKIIVLQKQQNWRKDEQHLVSIGQHRLMS